MSFPQQIEHWRKTVQNALFDVLAVNPERNGLISSLGLTNDALVDTTLALIQKESYGDSGAIGDNGNSIGLMQLNYGAGTPQSVGFTGRKEDLSDPYTNVYYGVKYLMVQLDRYRDIDKAILAFNAGSFRVDTAGAPINIDYLMNVLSFLGEKKTSFSWQHSASGSGTGSNDSSKTAPRSPDVSNITTQPAALPIVEISAWSKIKLFFSLVLNSMRRA